MVAATMTPLKAARERVASYIAAWDRPEGSYLELCIDDLRLILAALDEQEWRPIDDEARDGRSVLAYVPGLGLGWLVLYFDGGWREPANGMRLKIEPTVYCPLPAPPVEVKG